VCARMWIDRLRGRIQAVPNVVAGRDTLFCCVLCVSKDFVLQNICTIKYAQTTNCTPRPNPGNPEYM
jgi:hypothetical protein